MEGLNPQPSVLETAVSLIRTTLASDVLYVANKKIKVLSAASFWGILRSDNKIKASAWFTEIACPVRPALHTTNQVIFTRGACARQASLRNQYQLIVLCIMIEQALCLRVI